MESLENVFYEKKWDTIIVLDAARFDYFKEFYSIFPNLERGNLKKAKSPGSATPEVLPKLFDGYRDDWEIITGHPYIGPNRMVKTNCLDENYEWRASNHFGSVKNIQNQISECSPIKVITPNQVANAVLDSDNEKTIGWMLQPHAPYIGNTKLSIGKGFPWSIFTEEDGKLSKEVVTLIRVAYRSNLLRAFASIMNLVGKIDGRTIITADHGELLFEKERSKEDYGHPHCSNDKRLREVPYLTIDSDKTVNVSAINNTNFVRLCYNSVLNREPKEDALKEYEGYIGEEKVNRYYLLRLLHESDEYQERFGSPNNICTQKINDSSPFDKTEHKTNAPTELLEDLGYK